MKLYTLIGLILITIGVSFALYGLSLYDNSTVGIMAISLACTLGPSFALFTKRQYSKELRFNLR